MDGSQEGEIPHVGYTEGIPGHWRPIQEKNQKNIGVAIPRMYLDAGQIMEDDDDCPTAPASTRGR